MLIIFNRDNNAIIDKLPSGSLIEGLNPAFAAVDVPEYEGGDETSITAIPAAVTELEHAARLQTRLTVLVAELNAKYEGLGLSVNDSRAAAEAKLFDAEVTWEEVMKLNYVYNPIGGK